MKSVSNLLEIKMLHPQFLVDKDRTEIFAVLPIDEWRYIVSAIEELNNIRTGIDARNINKELLTIEQCFDAIANSRA